jgi:membrane fusion protein, multidrug efflux system
VPELALIREGNQSFVYTVGKDGKAKRLAVTTGGRDGTLVEITDGLSAGDRIVTEGVVKLSEGARVRTGPQERDPGAKSAK